MSWMAHSSLRRVAAALVLLAFSLAGIGRGLAAASGPAPAFVVIDGFVISLCHTDSGNGKDSPQNDSGHDCCDHCTLRTPVDVPLAPAFVPPARIAYAVSFETAMPRPAVLRQTHTPRSSQGPPPA